MAKKEVLLYSSIYSYAAVDFITAVEEYKADDITLRINCNGGNPEPAFGMIAKWKEHKGAKNIKVDGVAYSMAFFFLCYATDAECLDVSDFLVHRASFGEYYENNRTLLTDAAWESLDTTNASLRAAMEGKIDVKKFEQVSGVTMDQLFSMDARIDVKLNAKQALEIGLVNRIESITPEKKAEVEARTLQMAAHYAGLPKEATQVAPATPPTPKTNSNMNLAQFKADHPAIYAEVLKEERDRTGAHMAFIDVDKEAVVKAIESGADFTQKVSAEYTMKAIAKGTIAKMEAEDPGAVVTDPAEKPKTEAATKLAAFEAEVDKLRKV